MSPRRDEAARQIQRAARGFLTRRYLTFLAQFFSVWTQNVQSRYRGRRTRFAYKCIVDLTSNAQAAVRGFLVRKGMQKMRKERLSAYRKQICQLWRRTYTPLWYRTWFWSAVNRYRFLHLALHEDELIRLWSELGLKAMDYGAAGGSRELNNSDHGNLSVSSGLTHDSCEDDGKKKLEYVWLERMLGCKTTAVYKRFQTVQRRMESASSGGNNTTGSGSKDSSAGGSRMAVFPTENAIKSPSSQNAGLGQKADHMLAARKRLAKERDEIYHTLKNCKKTSRYGTLHRIYESFRIADNAKEKKRKVVDLLWEHRAYAKVSIEVVRLNEGNTDEFGKLSLHGTTGVTDLYQAKMREARNHLFFVQSASQWEDRGSSSGEDAVFRRQKRAIRKNPSMNGHKWNDCRSVIIGWYLSCGDGPGKCPYYMFALGRVGEGSTSGKSSGRRSPGKNVKSEGMSEDDRREEGSRRSGKKDAQKGHKRQSKPRHMPVPTVIGVENSPAENAGSSSDKPHQMHQRQDLYGEKEERQIRSQSMSHGRKDLHREKAQRALSMSHGQRNGGAKDHSDNLRKYWERIDSMKLKPGRHESSRSVESMESRQSSRGASKSESRRSKGRKAKAPKHLDDLEQAFGF